MNPNLALELITFGGLLLAATLGLYNNFPEIDRLTVIASGTGGSLCLLWGTLGLRSRSGLLAARVTVVVIALFAVVRTLLAWSRFAAGTVERAEPVMCTLGLIISCWMTWTLIGEGR